MSGPMGPHAPASGGVRRVRIIGNTLIGAGIVVGSGVALVMLGGVPLPAMPWIVAVGLAKLTLLGSGGLMAAGAVCNRLALRQEQRALTPPSRTSEPEV